MILDPRTNAVRGDLADIRLADRVFAPHYAAPLPVTVANPVALYDAPGERSVVIGHLASGDVFEVLELAGDHAWGIAPNLGLVGYISASAITGTANDG